MASRYWPSKPLLRDILTSWDDPVSQILVAKNVAGLWSVAMFKNAVVRVQATAFC
jgi:hypothetical protein